MSIEMLEYLSDMLVDRSNLYHDHKNNPDIVPFEPVLEKEQEFVNTCKELSKNKGFLMEAIGLDKKVKGESRKYEILHYIVLLSKDVELIKKIDILEQALSMIDRDEHKFYLDIFLEKDALLGYDQLIMNNNYTEYIPYFQEKLIETKKLEKKYDYHRVCSVMARFHQSEYYPEILEDIESDSLSHYEKDSLVFDCLSAPIPELWRFRQDSMREGLDEDGATLSNYGSPADIRYFQEGVKKIWDDEERLSNIGEWLKRLGYAGAFEWYFSMLKHPSDRVRLAFHRLMMRFFGEDDKEMEAGWYLEDPEIDYESYEYPEDAPFVSSKIVMDFWKSKKAYVNQTLDPNTRYFIAQYYHPAPFDFLEFLEYHESSYDYSHMNFAVRDLRIWLGINFVFDGNALLKNQVKDYARIKEWIKDNKERLPNGRWYRWGVDIKSIGVR